MALIFFPGRSDTPSLKLSFNALKTDFWQQWCCNSEHSNSKRAYCTDIYIIWFVYKTCRMLSISDFQVFDLACWKRMGGTICRAYSGMDEHIQRTITTCSYIRQWIYHIILYDIFIRKEIMIGHWSHGMTKHPSIDVFL